MKKFTLNYTEDFTRAREEFLLPAGWKASVFNMMGAPKMAPAAVGRALTQGLRQRLSKAPENARKTVAVAVEDIRRPLKLAPALEPIAAELLSLGFARENIRFVIALGCHAPMMRLEQIKKYGRRMAEGFRFENHNPFQNCAKVSGRMFEVDVALNRTMVEADVRILVGSVMPHGYMGFSGGAKLVVPGLSHIDTLESQHLYAVHKGKINQIEGNEARSNAEAIAEGLGVAFAVSLVANENGEIAGCFSGDLLGSHRQAMEFARRIYRTEAPQGLYDVAVLNAYPKDTEMIQAGNAFNALKSEASFLAPGASVVVACASCQGTGFHALHQPGGRVYRTPVPKKGLVGEREILVYSRYANEFDFSISFWEGYKLFKSWPVLKAYLLKKHGAKASLAVFPCASCQILERPQRELETTALQEGAIA
ncbi:MAG: DUF2088 domain-containing protein [Elusimicrobia bacterium]|nr:DUF2088 domain-containing protein [Elusimicrobiota bacterium]